MYFHGFDYKKMSLLFALNCIEEREKSKNEKSEKNIKVNI